MPYCARYRSFDLNDGGDDCLDVKVAADGHAPLLRRTLEATRLCKRAVEVLKEGPDLFGSVTPTYSGEPREHVYRLEGVRDARAVSNFLLLFENRIAIDLMPDIEECYALGPYSVSVNGALTISQYGKLVSQAKYRHDASLDEDVKGQLSALIQAHPMLRAVGNITAPDRDDQPVNSPWEWAQGIGASLGMNLVKTHKVHSTPPQKSDLIHARASEMDSRGREKEKRARVRNSMNVQGPVEGDVLVVDDTIESGGTLLEIARAFKDAGASKVYALSVAKDAEHTFGGIDLSAELWS